MDPLNLDNDKKLRIENYLKSLELQNPVVDEEQSIIGACSNISHNFTDIGSDNWMLNPSSIIAAVLGALAVISNIASLCAMMNIRPRLSANQRMIVSLTVSDIVLSIAVIAKLLGSHLNSPGSANCDNYVSAVCTEVVTIAVYLSSHMVTLFNLACLALDHFVAINKPLQYPRLLTRKHVSVLILILWVAAAFFGFSKFWMPSMRYDYCHNQHYDSYCFSVYCSLYEPEYLFFALVFITFALMGYFYTNIFITISKYQTISLRQDRRVRRNIKGLVTTVMILITFLVCWLPYCIFELVLIINMFTDHFSVVNNLEAKITASFYLNYLILLNGICDPVIYALRMRDVRRGYYQMIQCKSEDLTLWNGNTFRYTSTRDPDAGREFMLQGDDTRRISGPRRTAESHISQDHKENTHVLSLDLANL